MKNILKKIALVLSALGLLAAVTSLINRLIFFNANLKTDRIAENNGNYYDWKFGRVFYRCVGKGSPILMIHGMIPGSSSYEFSKIIRTLSRQNKVYAIDLIGFGLSDKPKMTYTAYLYVQLIHDFIHHVIKSPVTLITNGDSNAYTAMVTMQDGDLIRKMIWINPATPNLMVKNPGKRDALVKYILEMPVLGTHVYLWLVSKMNIRHIMKTRCFASRQNITPTLVNNFHASSHLGNGSNRFIYASKRCHYTNVNIKKAVSQLNHSVHMIIGDDYYSDYIQVMEHYKALNAAIECSVIHHTGAFPHLEKPASTLEVLKLYLS